MIKKTERGWPGHFCLAHQCSYHRNTLLEMDGHEPIVVSTVGRLYKDGKVEPVGVNVYYETLAFIGTDRNGKIAADVDRQIYFYSDWWVDAVDETSDIRADMMHDGVIEELSAKMARHAITIGSAPGEKKRLAKELGEPMP